MTKIKVAICDQDEVYRQRFAEYLMYHKQSEMEVYSYSKGSIFKDALAQLTFDLIMLGKGFEDFLSALKAQGVPVLMLLEGNADFVHEGFLEEHQESENKVIYTSKYQSTDNIIKKMYLLTEKESAGNPQFQTLEKGMEIIGVCSPAACDMQLPFSLLYAMEQGKNQRVLYLNLMNFSGFLELCEEECEYDLGDIVLALRSQSLTSEQFRSSIYELGDISYIPPFQNPQNHYEFSQKDFLEVVTFICNQGKFDALVIDFGINMEHFSEALSVCHKIYCLTREGYFYQCQQNQFWHYLEVTGAEGLCQKVHFLDLPFTAKWIRGGGDFIEQLKWSAFGDFVRRFISGGADLCG